MTVTGLAGGFCQHPPHRRIAFDIHTQPLGLTRHRLRDRTHAAHRVTPDAGLAIHFAEGVMQQHVAAARCVRAAVIADHRIEAVQRLDRIALKPGVQNFTGAARKELVHLALCAQRQRTKFARQFERAPQIAGAPQIRGRNAQQLLAQQHHGAI